MKAWWLGLATLMTAALLVACGGGGGGQSTDSGTPGATGTAPRASAAVMTGSPSVGAAGQPTPAAPAAQTSIAATVAAGGTAPGGDGTSPSGNGSAPGGDGATPGAAGTTVPGSTGVPVSTAVAPGDTPAAGPTPGGPPPAAGSAISLVAPASATGTVQLTVRVAGPPPPYRAYNIGIRYDPNLVSVKDTTEGDVFTGQKLCPGESNLAPNLVVFACTMLGPGTVTAEGVLATFTFDVKAAGTATFHLVTWDETPADQQSTEATFLVDSDALPFSVATQDATVGLTP